MRLLTPEQALSLDRQTFQNAPAKSEQFARSAAHAIFRKLKDLAQERKRTLVLIGPGHNGWDACLTAELLVPTAPLIQQWTLQKDSINALRFDDFDLVIDGLFGIGLNRPLDGDSLQVVTALNENRKNRKKTKRPLRILAIDVPSGLNALTGWPQGQAVQADWTVTFQAAKPGFFQNQGPLFTGRLFIAKLPYSDSLFAELSNTHFACGMATASRLLPRRPSSSNKGSFGTLNLVAGSGRYPGAGILAARAGLRAGVGYLKFVHFDALSQEWMQVPETLPEHWNEIPNKLSNDAAWALGPGVNDRKKLLQLMRKLLEQGCEKVILDATALDLIPEIGKPLPRSWLVTPHPKEMARLLGTSVEDVQRDRFQAAAKAHQKFGATVLLKGYKTVVHSEGRSFIILRGHQALAKAGSGDVLTGLLGSYRAQGLGVLETAVLGALVQGIAADHWMKTGDTASMNPSDLVESLPIVQKQIKNWRPS